MFKDACKGTITDIEDRADIDAKCEAPQMGYGACLIQGCLCKQYASSGWNCTNCTHSFNDHSG